MRGREAALLAGALLLFVFSSCLANRPPVIAFASGSVGGAETISFTEEGLPSGMAWSVTLNGETFSSTLSSFAVHVNLPYGQYNWTTPTLSVGAGTRYAVNQSSGTLTVDSPQASIALHFYEQFEGFFSWSLVGWGGEPPYPPQLTRVSFGISSSAELSPAPRSLWLDAGTSWSVPGQLPFVEGFGVLTERFATPNPVGDASPGANLTINYYDQYRLRLEYALAGGGSPPSPTLTSEQFGASFSATLTGSAVDYWVDSGQPWSVTNSISGSNPSERWYSFQATNGIAGVGLNANLTYYHQYELSFSYSISGGGSPAAPTVSYVSAGAPQASPLTTSPSDHWVDSGQPWSMTNPLLGSNSTIRWMADNSSAAGTVSSSAPISVTYYRQVSVTVARSPSDGGSVSSSGGWYGVGVSFTLTASPSPGWEFAGWDGTGTGSYTGTAGSASLTASSPIMEVAEFHPGLTIAASDGGSVSYRCASLSGSVAAGTSRTIYVQSGVSVAITSEPAFMYSFSGWSGALGGTGPQSISVSSPVSVQGSFAINMLYTIVIVAAALIVAFGAFVTFRRRKSAHSQVQAYFLRVFTDEDGRSNDRCSSYLACVSVLPFHVCLERSGLLTVH